MGARRFIALVVMTVFVAGCGSAGNSSYPPPPSAGEPAASPSAAPAKDVERPVAAPSAVRPASPVRPHRPKDNAPFGPAEVRASWVVAFSLHNADAIADVVDEAVALRANTLLLQVRSRGDAYYPSKLEPEIPEVARGGFDPLALAIADCEGDLDVHAWINMCLVASAETMPASPRHVVLAHPEWLAVPEALAPALRKLSPSNPGYVEALRRYAEDHKTSVEGMFIDPAIPEARAHVAAVVADICRRYPLRGIHLDYIRYAARGFGWGKATLDLFRAEVDRELSKADRNDMAQRAAKDPFAYAKRYAARFALFRRNAVTALVRDAARAAREARPGILVSAAVLPDIATARDDHFQDWTDWLATGLIDAACPMIYTQHADAFKNELRAAVQARGRGRIWAGIGAWILPAKEIARRVDVVRTSGAQGVALFSHQGLRDVPGAMDALKSGPFTRRARPQ